TLERTTDAVRFHIKPDLTSADRELLSTHRALLLDMIKVNRWQRPVQFTLACPPFVTTGIDDYLQLAGLTRRLVPFMAKATGRFIDVELLISLLVDQTNFRFLPTVRDQDIPRISNILNNYRVLFLLVSDTLTQCGRQNRRSSIQ
ncbi:MAG: hypothetical protein QME25_08165, partial [Bacteroidota bacterium]|nr:hypothetical protein [Bacteroidota bacterium]